MATVTALTAFHVEIAATVTCESCGVQQMVKGTNDYHPIDCQNPACHASFYFVLDVMQRD
jgi:hypothetical protein